MFLLKPPRPEYPMGFKQSLKPPRILRSSVWVVGRGGLKTNLFYSTYLPVHKLNEPIRNVSALINPMLYIPIFFLPGLKQE